jgi:hypothetical protein
MRSGCRNPKRANRAGETPDVPAGFSFEGVNMAAIMSLYEPRPRGTVLGERVDRRRVREAEHFFRCEACSGWIDARDLVWTEDHEGPLPHPAQDQAQ